MGITTSFDEDEFIITHEERPSAIIGMVRFKSMININGEAVFDNFPYLVLNYHEGKCL